MPLATKLGIRDEGTDQGRVKIVDFVGSTISASVSGAIATVTSTAGSGDVTGDDTSTTAQNIVAYTGTGGKNITELTGTQGDVLYHNGTSWVKLGAGTSGNFLKTQGVGANPIWDAASGGASLDAITAAAADQAGIANADWNVRWNWAKTTNSEQAFRFSESAAATGGTSSSGVPNQVLLQLDTLAASTMSPLKVLSRAAHVFSVSPTAAQILTAAGSAANPILASAAVNNYGIYFTIGGFTSISANSALVAQFQDSQIQIIAGSAATPALTDTTQANSGPFWPASSVLGFSINGIENSRLIAGGFQLSKGTADAVAYVMNFRKSRGTVASPTVITSGDDLATISGYGYVGATNTFQEACRFTLDSTGTISDSATGIGGIIRCLVATVGAEPVEILNVTGNAVNCVMGLSTTFSPTVTTANVNTTAVGTAGAGPDDLMTYALPANSFSAAGKGVHITAWGTTANNAETKTLTLAFGSTILTNALTANLAGIWRIEADVFSTGTDTQDYVAQLVTVGAAGVALNDIETGSLTEDDGAAITIKCTGDVGAPSTNNGIVQEGMIVKFIN